MWIIFQSRVKGKESDRMISGEFSENVIATDLSAAVWWNQATSFDPQDFHGSGLTSRSLRMLLM